MKTLETFFYPVLKKTSNASSPSFRIRRSFFQPAPEFGHSIFGGLYIPIYWLLENESESFQPIACLPRLEFDVAYPVQELDHYDTIPSRTPQTEFLRRLRQCLGQLLLRRRTHASRTPRTLLVEHTVESALVGLAEPVDNRLPADPKELAYGG